MYRTIQNLYVIYLTYHGQLDNKLNVIITTYKELLGTCIKPKNQHIYSM